MKIEEIKNRISDRIKEVRNDLESLPHEPSIYLSDIVASEGLKKEAESLEWVLELLSKLS